MQLFSRFTNHRKTKNDSSLCPDLTESSDSNLLYTSRLHKKHNRIKNKRYKLFLVLICLIFILFVLNLFENLSLQVSFRTTASNFKHQTYHTTILISIDGFKSSYITKSSTPFLYKLQKQSLIANMIPSFPTITFPNHYTLATGLYPDYHGIVANDFYDITLNKTFKHILGNVVKEEYWWLGEPIWITLQKNNNHKAAVHMWPGSETKYKNNTFKPYYLTRFKMNVLLEEKMDEIIYYLKMKNNNKPKLIMSYVYEVDTFGHDFGTQAEQTYLWIKKIDIMMEYLFEKLSNLGLPNKKDKVDIILVSDHGMTDVNKTRLIFIDDYVDVKLIYPLYVYPYAGIFPRDLNNIEKIYNELKIFSEKKNSHFKVYKKQDLPSKYHYGTNIRIPPIGYAFVLHSEIEQTGFSAKGLHGYDNYDSDMQALFMAYGPSFKKGKLDPFENVNIYNLLCYLLNIEPASNNGTFEWSKILVR